MPAQCQQAGWVAWGLCFLSLPQSQEWLWQRRSSCSTVTGMPVPSLRGSYCAGLALGLRCSAGCAEAALGHSAPAPFSNRPLTCHGCTARLCLGALWVSWSVSGGLGSAMGLTHSQCCGVGDCLSSSISKPFPFVSTRSFLLSKSSAAFPISSSNGTPGMSLLQGHQLSQTCHHLPCWADRGAAQPLPCSHTVLHTVAIGTVATAAPSRLQAGQ